MDCRPRCGACCIAPSISSPIPGMPDGKPAGVRCVQLDGRPALRACSASPSGPRCAARCSPATMCGDSREQAMRWLGRLEDATPTPMSTTTPDRTARNWRRCTRRSPQLPDALRDQVLDHQAMWLSVPAGTTLFEERRRAAASRSCSAARCASRAARRSGRSLELYRVSPGELCVVSTSCLFGQHAAQRPWRDHRGHRAWCVLTPAAFDAWLRPRAVPPLRVRRLRRPPGRPDGAGRGGGLPAPGPAPGRRAARPRRRCCTPRHQALADELGTVREIVTRLLRRFERAGWVALGARAHRTARCRARLRRPSAAGDAV